MKEQKSRRIGEVQLKLAEKGFAMGRKTEKICNGILVSLTAIFLLFLTGMSALFSQRCGKEEWNEIDNGAPIYQVQDNLLWHFVGILLLIALLIFLYDLQKRIRDKGVFFLQSSIALAAGFIAYMILAGGMRTPSDDQAQVYGAAALFNQGQYISLTKGGYLNMYPQQLGYVAYIQIVFRLFGNENFYALQLLNCLWIAGIVWVLCLCLNECTDRKEIRLAGSFLLLGFLPLFLMGSWVYGDVPGLFFVSLAYRNFLKYKKTGQIRRLAIMVPFMCLSLLFRKNSLIFLIAFLIILFFQGLEEKKIQVWVALVLLAVIPLGSVAVLEQSYEKVSGYEIDGGLPGVMWIAMGMSEDASKPGWFSNYSVPIYYSVDCDRRLAAEKARERIRERMELFRQEPVYALSFYKRKICTQWNDPFYHTNFLIATDEESTGLTGFLEKAEDGILFTFLSTYQFLIYSGAFFYVCRSASRNQICDQFPLIAFVGGMLFSVLWEGNSRYVLPYVVMLIPVSVMGWYQILQGIRSLGKKENFFNYLVEK